MLSWTWNNTLTFKNSDISIEIGFTSNGQHFDSLLSQKVDSIRYFGYCNGTTCTPVYEYNSQSTGGAWTNSSFKNITFDTLPNEQLMSILSVNATVNKNISKVEINGATLIDISNDTVAANILAEGYTAHDKTGNTITGTLTQQSGKTVTPGISDVVAVESGKYTTGTVYVKGDSNLTAGNIKSGISIFGVTGSYAGSSPNLQSKSVTYTSNGTATITPDNGYDGLSSVDVTVDVASGGGSGSSANWNDVTFIDYDGSVLYSYSLAEAQALTDIPTLPSHDGLVCQGWNWTLEAIKALNRPVTVGAMYITDDGATRLHIRIATVGRMTVPLYIGQTVANGVSIDWGDESTAETLAGTGNVNTSHTYAEPGDYVISLMPQEGCTLSFGNGSSSYCVMGSTGNNGKVYCNMLQEFYVGKNVTSIGNSAFRSCQSLSSITIKTGVTSIGNSAFRDCYSLASITIPTGVTSIDNDAFYNCRSLSSITITDGVTSIGNSAFNGCQALSSITIPTGVTSIGTYSFSNCYSLVSTTITDGVTSIGNSAFSGCQALSSITIPTGVTSIGNYSFANCYGMRYYDFSACTAIPALSSKSAFNNIPSDCQMLIPSALYNNWKSATNWASYASKMVSVER